MTSESHSAASGSSTIALTSASCGTSVGRAATVPTKGSSSKLLTGIQTGSSAPDDPHVCRRQPDLLPRLAQRGGLRPGIGRVHRAAGQRDLAGVGAEVAVANGQRDDEVAVGVGIDGEQGRGRACRRERAHARIGAG